MPDKTISILGAATITLGGLYLLLVGMTVYFVSTETRTTTAMHVLESKITVLEKDYYASISTINAEKPEAYGLVAPRAITYVAAPLRPTLSSAQN